MTVAVIMDSAMRQIPRSSKVFLVYDAFQTLQSDG